MAYRYFILLALLHAAGVQAAAPPDELVQLRGPLHEGFAMPLAGASEAGSKIDQRPGPLRDELPTAVKPAATGAVWLAGYWGWEPADKRFVWVPGVWRVRPPGMRWVPGYWSDQDDGCVWVRGFWYPLNEPRLRYLPEPPERREEPASRLSIDQFAVPGHWTYLRGQYRWDRGFAAQHKTGWVWIASHYVWTPRGSIFLPGYWDHALANRGLAFAPVRGGNDSQTTAARGVAYTPQVAINLSDLGEALFVDPGLGHYYFGDYFGQSGENPRPWYKPDGEFGLDPNFAYERWRRRAATGWPAALADRYRRRREHAELRPPVAYALARRQAGEEAGDVPELGLPVKGLAHAPSGSGAVAEIAAEAIPRVEQNVAADELLSRQRAHFEASGPPATGDAPLAFYLPAPVEAIPPTRPKLLPRSATAGQYVPGVKGRAVPGAAPGTLPGMSGRTVPGVDIHVPGATAPGVLPGADADP